MNEIRQGWIEQLAEKAEMARMAFESLGMRNIYGKTSEERVAMAKEYAVAEALMVEANAKLRAAISSSTP